MKEILKELIVKNGYSKVIDECRKIDQELWEEGKTKRQLDYEKNKIAYEKRKERERCQGEMAKELIEIGDVIQCKGTRDGKGFREVIDKDEYSITCRKLFVNRFSSKKEGITVFEKDSYITVHDWSKVSKIFLKNEYKLID